MKVKSLEIKHQFSFPPKNQEDMKIMKYTEFLEIEVYDNPGSPEIFYSVSIDPKTIRCSPRFLEFIKDCGHYETSNGPLRDIFRYSCEDSTDLLFFSAGTKYFLIDREGYVHLGTVHQEVNSENLKFLITVLKDYYGFKIYEEERPRV
jgi:hypothetical protein